MRRLLVALVLAVAGCGDGGMADPDAAFAEFVSAQVVATADDSDAVPINDLDFSDADLMDEDLFAGLFD
jgi:hypothetical protein